MPECSLFIALQPTVDQDIYSFYQSSHSTQEKTLYNATGHIPLQFSMKTSSRFLTSQLINLNEDF
jgi:hypothetical protein